MNSNYVAEIQSTCIPNEQLASGNMCPPTYVSRYELLVRDTCVNVYVWRVLCYSARWVVRVVGLEWLQFAMFSRLSTSYAHLCLQSSSWSGWWKSCSMSWRNLTEDRLHWQLSRSADDQYLINMSLSVCLSVGSNEDDVKPRNPVGSDFSWRTTSTQLFSSNFIDAKLWCRFLVLNAVLVV